MFLQVEIFDLKRSTLDRRIAQTAHADFITKPCAHRRPALTAFRNTTPPSLARHKSGCPVPRVEGELLPACEASGETVSRALVMRADRRLHSSLISKLSRRIRTADVMLLLDWSLLCLTIATGTTHGAPLRFMGNSVRFL
ncbi:uncharacterized [Tachysurus ichikawai]